MYDIAILGGGISGLYIAYRIIQSGMVRPDKILIVEKSRVLGGRVDSYHDEWMSVEAGAGRIHSGHKLILGLIRELGLESKLVAIDNSARFVREEGVIEDEQPHVRIMSTVMRESKRRTKRELIGKTLLEFTREVCGAALAKEALGSFGYTTEFLKMNAYDAIALMGIIATPQKYYVLSGGLSQVIDRLAEVLRGNGCHLNIGREVKCVEFKEAEAEAAEAEAEEAEEAEDFLYKIICGKGESYLSSRCICTFPAEDVLRLKIVGLGSQMTEWKRTVRASIYGGSLCRIYSQFGRGNDDDDDVWFSGLGKLTLTNDLRQIIPIDEKTGVVMISYSDGANADKWNKLMSEGGIRAVNRQLKMLVDSALGISIPGPRHTKIFYWSNGVGYWRVGADSLAVEKKAAKGCSGMHFCGENYSSKNQQWIEGALDTADRVLDEIL